ncbi:hypothetical protein Z517_11450 [Fonsecaea pedrosoi CBS 271.37]|uniref:Unplaced genomic scaffold supercont1.8, whole genome shotgun sequence n=1 Tax=Fonsecaea pedrosoi CBS 271.37 TaxID=1442368 RepID=A0A0D2G7G6_9EURO|nr:uncharacterized protein Z517_11450 [Fonsecaea pedrosoi CBS 271.37]KIW74680.1 hypothetical protein Z517_11450 [Fonsecaea pedrosoi CBS 271.37]
MAKAIKIEHLLLQNPSPSIGEEPPPRAPAVKRDATQSRQPAHRPQLELKTSSTSLVPARSPAASERFSWDFDNEELSSNRRRKRKSPIEDQVFPTRKAIRLPRFSVNIFHSEPVNVFPIPNEGVVPRMVKYYLQVWAEQHGRALAFEGHPKPYQSLVFPYALEHAVLFEAMVALSRASWLLQEGIPWSKDSALAYHRANAFAALRLRLTSEATCADDTTICTIAALTTIDYMLGVHEGAHNHINAMQRIRKIRTDLKGDTPWQYFVISAMKAYDALWKFVKDRNEATTSMAQLSIESPMRNELPLYPSLPFNIKVCEALSKVSTSFNDMAMAGEMSIQMIDILANLSKTARGDGSATPTSSPPSSPGGRNLLNTIADLRCLSVMATTSIEHKLCFGVIGTCFTLHFGDGKIGEEFNETLQELEDGLLGNGKPRPQQEKAQKNHRECLIWVALAAAGALEQSELLSAMSMLLDQTLDKYPEETARWETLEGILKKFLWNDLLARHWRRCWAKAVRRRSSPSCVAN